MACATSTTRRAFTLAECLIATAILGIAVAGVTAPINATYQQIRMAEEMATAASLCRQLLDEITARPLAEPADGTTSLGKENGESTRDTFDNVDDYDHYTDTTDSLLGLDGKAIAWNNRGPYQRQVRVEYRSTPQGPKADSGDFALVTVTVTGPSGTVATAKRLVTTYVRGN